MADKVTIKNVHPEYDGEYELDNSTFTMGELHEIKKMTGLRLGEFEDAALAGDLDFIVALAITALKRAGKPIHPQVIWDAEAGSILYEVGDEGDVVPPASGAAPQPTSSGV